MGLGIYKWGQGYWVRVLTAVFALIVIGVGGAWLSKSIGAYDVPKKSWTMLLTPIPGQEVPANLASGATIVLLGESPEPGRKGPEIGTAKLLSIATAGANKRMTVDKFVFSGKSDPQSIKGIALAAGGSEVAAVSGVPQGEAVFELLYLQAGGVAILVVLGAIAVYWFVGAHHKTVDFLIATDGEMKKVNWSTKKDIIGSTKVVILWCVLLVAGLFFVDLAFSTFFKLIGVLQTK